MTSRRGTLAAPCRAAALLVWAIVTAAAPAARADDIDDAINELDPSAAEAQPEPAAPPAEAADESPATPEVSAEPAAGVPARETVAPLTSVLPVIVAARPGAGQAAALINREFRLTLGATGEFDPVFITEFRDEEKAAQYKRALELLQEGKNLWVNLDPERGLPALEEATNLFEQTLVINESNRAYLEALTFLGAFQALFGRRDDALQTYVHLLGIEPTARLNREAFPPTVQDVFQEAIRVRLSADYGSVQISTLPAYAEIYFDGAFKGISPVTVKGVVPGPHRVRAVLPGFGQWDERMTVPEGKLTRKRLTITADPRRRMAGASLEQLEAPALLPPEQRKLHLSGLAKTFDAGRVLVGRVVQDELVLKVLLDVYDRDTGAFCSAENEIEIYDSSYVKVITSGAVQMLRKPGAACAAAPPPAVEASADGGSVVTRWWFWTIIGGVVAAGGVTAVLVAM